MTVDDFFPVAQVADVPPGKLVEIDLDGEDIVLGNDDGEFFAVSAWCAHEGATLALGHLHNHVLTCFAHQWTYDVRTGATIWPPLARVAPGYRLRTYRTRVENGNILVARKPSRLGLG